MPDAFEHRLRGWARTLYLYCDSARRMPQLIQQVHDEDPGVEETEIHRKLCEWIEAGVLVKIDDAYLSLALMS